jgi:carbamoyl-phosphate synthase small subunit
VVAYDFGVKRNILRMLAEPRLPRDRGAGADARAEVLALQARRRLPVQRPGRPRALRLRDRRVARTDRHRHPDLRHLPGPPDHGAGLGREDLQDEVRPPRRQPSGEGPRHRPGQHHQPEPRLRGRPHACRPTCAPPTSLFDGTLQGLARTDRPAFCFQGHPEASPGPHDIAYLFDRFVALMEPMPLRHCGQAASPGAPSSNARARPEHA